MLKRLLLPLLAALSTLAAAEMRVRDVIYMKSGGAAFTMDVVRPAKPNRAGVIFLVSGGWISDHAMIQTFGSDIEREFVKAGFTVFEVVHGAQPRYRVEEIVAQVRSAARFVHAHAADYRVDPGRLGVTGISSGGHLSLMVAGAVGRDVRAVAAIAPPTDLTNWGKPGVLLTDEPMMAMFRPALGLDASTPKEAAEVALKKLSPLSLVNSKFPATLIVHGDTDPVVPLQQGQSFDRALGTLGARHRLVVIPGGGHDEKTFVPGVHDAVRWFRETLLK